MPRKGYKQKPSHRAKTISYLKNFKKGFDERRFGKGSHHTQEVRKKLSGENNHFWKGGVTPINQKIRTSLEYKLWRNSVYERDNYTCVWCGSKDKRLNADHIKPFAFYPELRFAIDNGRTLCIDCHKTTKTFGKSRL